ncbi:MAG: SUF system NifU family Fe-S cluster assembly protein [Ignavibacteria bacterium]|nr:SUF system NifU family Fe-S cluster assembly protein [Ignavibacteria bacterium]
MESSDLLYQEIILDHNRNPRNFGELSNATHKAVGHNPLCGDYIELYLIVKDNVIVDVKFSGVGCAISKSSASIMTTILKGKTIEEAKQIFNDFHTAITSEIDKKIDTQNLGKLEVFLGVREFPVRVKCVTLPWHTFIDAIEKNS